MNKPIVTATAGYAMLTQDQWITEVMRLEGLVASVTAERDSARDIACRSGYFQNTKDSIRLASIGVECKGCSFPPQEGSKWCESCDTTEPARPSAYDMPVGSVVRANDYDGNLRTLQRVGVTWSDGKSLCIQSGWIEGLFSDGLVTEWRLP